jgi:hypothetical protein
VGSPKKPQGCGLFHPDSSQVLPADGLERASMRVTREQGQDRLEKYFGREDTPSRNSPVGKAMVRILAKYPGISFEEARTKAHELLNTAAKARNYRGPVVLSAEQLTERKNRMEGAFRGPGYASTLSKTSIPGDSSACVNTQQQLPRGSTPTVTPEALETAPIAISTFSSTVGVRPEVQIRSMEDSPK